MAPESQRLSYQSYLDNAQAIFDSFPNEKVWARGGFRPNRQLQNPEAGYCIVLRYGERTTRAISQFMAKVGAVLPPFLEYREQDLHTTIGTYGKGHMVGFVPSLTILQSLMKAVEKCTKRPLQHLQFTFERWLYNDEVILLSGYPNLELWSLFQEIGSACDEGGCPLETARITHVTTARFICSASHQEFMDFNLVMKSAPAIETCKPKKVDLASWRCDGKHFALVTHQCYEL